jgi:15-hydroxyprostaglandin dehydrogenase (NAD)
MIKTAIVTGACSGMGLALVQRLLHDFESNSPQNGGAGVPTRPQKWRVVLADINEKAYDVIRSTLPAAESRYLFVRTDVSSWDSLVNLFRATFEWPGEGQGRIDFLACNAGIDDYALKSGLLDEADDGDHEADPVQPDLRVLQVDLHSNFFATKLLVHYTRKTKRMLALSNPSSIKDWTPKLIITASMAAQYPFFLIPQYTAAKHGCLGLVRALSPALLKCEGITLNCLLPGTVDTGLIPPPVLEQWNKEHLTPVDTILRAFMELIGDWDRATLSENVISDAPDRKLKNGCAVECSARWLWYRDPVPFKDESMKFVSEQCKEEGILGRFARDMKAQMKLNKG